MREFLKEMLPGMFIGLLVLVVAALLIVTKPERVKRRCYEHIEWTTVPSCCKCHCDCCNESCKPPDRK